MPREKTPIKELTKKLSLMDLVLDEIIEELEEAIAEKEKINSK